LLPCASHVKKVLCHAVKNEGGISPPHDYSLRIRFAPHFYTVGLRDNEYPTIFTKPELHTIGEFLVPFAIYFDLCKREILGFTHRAFNVLTKVRLMFHGSLERSRFIIHSVSPIVNNIVSYKNLFVNILFHLFLKFI